MHEGESRAPPIVLVPGFLGRSSDWHLRTLERQHPTERFIASPPGPLSSHHDRACEIFYFLKGGRIDYGECHAASCGHARHGRSHVGAYREWDAENPVDLVGHSIGGVTARMLQQLLADQAFPGHETSAAWIRSIVCLSSPLNGDPVVYGLGLRAEVETLRSPPSIFDAAASSSSAVSSTRCQPCAPPQPYAPSRSSSRPYSNRRSYSGGRQTLLPVRLFSAGWLLTTAAHLLLWLDVRTLLPVDMQLDHWHLSRRKSNFFTSLSNLIKALAWQGSFGQRWVATDFAHTYPLTARLLARRRTA